MVHVKDFWKIVPFPTKIKLVWDRLTLTKTTTVYFVLLLHCVIQVVVQAHAFQFNVWAAGFSASITKQGNAVNSKSFYIFQNDLRLCNFVLHSSTLSCEVLWDGTVGKTTSVPLSALETLVTNTTADASTSTNFRYSTSAFIPTAIEDAQSWDQGPCNDSTVVECMSPNTTETVESNGTVRVVLDGPGQNKESAILDRECLLVLGWPVQTLQNTEREDLVFIMFQILVLGMSMILNKSIPHMIATLLTHLVATGWTGFQIFSTIRFRSDFAAVTTNGACHSVDLLQAYWQSRAGDELSSLISNSVALLVSTFLCWKLAKSFGWQTFKRIGRPTLSVAPTALERCYRSSGKLATISAFLTVTLVFLPLWLAFGWYSVRREHKVMTFAFLALCCGYLAGWGAMFDSVTFRWTYMTWPFFAAMTTASVLLTLLASILGIVCCINFRKGMPYYLKAHELTEEGFEAVDPEKVAFPSSKEPTYAIPFGSGVQFLPQVSDQKTAQPCK